MAPKRRKYDVEKLKEAVAKIKSGELGVKEAHRRYDIPVSTLSAHKNDRRSYEMGRPTVLTKEEEQGLVDVALKFTEVGLPKQEGQS